MRRREGVDVRSVGSSHAETRAAARRQAQRPIEGGGHVWPGGAQHLPPRLTGPFATDLDATGIILAAFAAAPR